MLRVVSDIRSRDVDRIIYAEDYIASSARYAEPSQMRAKPMFVTPVNETENCTKYTFANTYDYKTSQAYERYRYADCLIV